MLASGDAMGIQALPPIDLTGHDGAVMSRYLSGIVCCLLVACGSTEQQPSSIFGEVHTTEMGLYSITFEGPEIAHTVGVNRYTITLQTSDGMALSQAEVMVTPWMPDHGHGSDRAPTIEEEAPGRYVITDVSYTMPGRWQVMTTVTAVSGMDSVTLDIDVQ